MVDQQKTKNKKRTSRFFTLSCYGQVARDGSSTKCSGRDPEVVVLPEVLVLRGDCSTSFMFWS